MKNFVVIVLLLMAGHATFSQEKLPPTDTGHSKYFIDTLVNFGKDLRTQYQDTLLTNGDKIETKGYFDAFFSKWLSYVNFAKDGYPDGNSVLVAPSSASTLGRVTLAHKGKFVVYNAGTQLNFSNNIANVISKSDVTSNTTFFGSVSIMPKKTRKLAYDGNRASQNDSDKIVLLSSFIAGVQKKYESDYFADTLKYAKLLDSIKNAGGAAGAPATMLVDYYAILQKLRSYGFNENIGFYNVGFMNTKIKTIEDSVSQVIDSLELTNDAIRLFTFGWFSGSFAYTRNDYSTYNGNAVFAKRIGNVYFDSLAFGIGYNFLFERNEKLEAFASTVRNGFLDRKWLRSFYFNVNYNLTRDINFAHMTPTTLVTSQNITDPNNTGSIDTVYQIQSQTKGINITNKPQVLSWEHTFSVKQMTVLTSSSFMGWDLSFTATYGKLIQPIYNLQTGILFRFSDSQAQKTKVNFEIFLQLNDFVDSQHSGLSTWQRKVVGINLSVPFSKLFF